MPPRPYCPRTARRAISCAPANGLIAGSSFSFSSRIASGWNDVGGSMRNSDNICSTWFCTMSRIAPAVS
jgi:hypothetical protein